MIVKEELLGQHVSVVRATNKDLVGLSGKVVDETKQTLRIQTMRGEKTLLKEQVTLEARGFEVDGKLLKGRPEKRIKNKVTKWQRKKP